MRLIYIYGPTFTPNSLTVQKLEPGLAYTAYWWNPRTGVERPLGLVAGDAVGAWTIPMQPELTDWVLVLKH